MVEIILYLSKKIIRVKIGFYAEYAKNMYTISCKEAGQMDCDYVAKGKTKEEAVADGLNHTKKEHPEDYKKMMDSVGEKGIKAELMNMVKEE